MVTFLAFAAVFWGEVSLAWHWFFGRLRIIFFDQPVFLLLNAQIRANVFERLALFTTEEMKRALGVLAGNYFVGFFTYSVILFWMAQFVLPVRQMNERLKAFGRLWLYLFRAHGPTIFVNEGVIKSDKTETKKSQPGVALVDLSSALVLEKSIPRKGRVSDPNLDDDDEQQEQPRSRRLRFFGKKKQKEQPWLEIKSYGPGLVFTEYGQKIHGAVDLRRQVRVAPKIDAYTRDGIKVESTVYTIFSLSEEPETINVTYVGGLDCSNLRAVILEKNDKTGEKVAALYRLNPADAEEIHSIYETKEFHLGTEGQKEANHQAFFSLPFPFHEERVTQAVYYLPHLSKDQVPVHWTDLPNMAAIETFRNTIALYSYDHMHAPDDREDYPLKQIKQEFSLKVCSQGLIKYQMATRRDGLPISVEDVWVKDDLIFKPIPKLTNHQMLRDRGIKVVAAGFSELKPPEAVRKELMDTWQARWEREINSLLAKHDLEAARIRNRARVRAQQGASFVLSDVFTDVPFSEEALTVRVFQALESAVTDLGESRLLPHDTIDMLYNLYQWMITEEEKPKTGSTLSPEENMPGGVE